MVPYTEKIPGTDLEFEMLPIPGGVVTIYVGAQDGPPASCEVVIPPFWAARCEVTWGEYRRYMALDTTYSQLLQLSTLRSEPEGIKSLDSKPKLAAAVAEDTEADASDLGVDAVTAPTPLYDPSTTYESGDDAQLPAVTMSPFAARQYTKWLSSLTGRDYRLPSEAEWMHAAAAGEPVTGVPDSGQLDASAWYADNSDYVAQHVGKKAPNKWGLHDTLGNAAEHVLDAFLPEGRPALAGKRLEWQEAVAWPGEGQSRLAKGGWYDAEAEEISLAGRLATDESDWKSSDPNLPQSPWWYSDYPATGVGFRVVRPLDGIPDKLKRRVWDTTDPVVIKAINERLREGRGKVGPIGKELPELEKDLRSSPVQGLLK